MAHYKTRFGKYTIIDISEIKKNGKKCYKCRCKCGNISILPMTALRVNKTGCKDCYNKSKRKLKSGDKINNIVFLEYCDKNCIMIRCHCGKCKRINKSSWGVIKSCGCLAYKKGLNANTYCGTKYISGTHINRCRYRAKQGNMEYILTNQDLDNILKKQNFRCSLSGLPIVSTTSDRTASLDRIDSSKGYTKDNSQWVHKYINIAKNDLSQDDFIYLCHLVAENNKKPESSIFDADNVDIKRHYNIIEQYQQEYK